MILAPVLKGAYVIAACLDEKFPSNDHVTLCAMSSSRLPGSYQISIISAVDTDRQVMMSFPCTAMYGR